MNEQIKEAPAGVIKFNCPCCAAEIELQPKKATAGTMAETVNVEEYFKERGEITSRIQKRV